MTSLGHQHHVLVICLARSTNCICIHLPWLCSLGWGILARQSQRSQIDFGHFCQSVPDVMFTKNSQIGFGHFCQSVPDVMFTKNRLALGTSASLSLMLCSQRTVRLALGTSASLSLMSCSQRTVRLALGTSTSLWLWALLPVCGFGHFYQSVALGTSYQSVPDVMFTSESRWQFLKLEVLYRDKQDHTPPSRPPPPTPPPVKNTPTAHQQLNNTCQ